MTKTIVLGTSTKEHKNKKIKFTHSLNSCGHWCTAWRNAKAYDYVELISLGYGGDFDIMFVYDKNINRADGVLYKGKWNDGIA
jgi:hypothetical protein